MFLEISTLSAVISLVAYSFMDFYPETLDKVALAVESSKIAKSLIVQQEGIGEDLSFSLMAWCDDELVAVAQLSGLLMADHDERYGLMVQAACILRQGWDATAFTMVAEGFCSTNPNESRGNDMAQLFASPSCDFVRECLAFTHVEEDELLFVVVPYKYEPPRRVLYSDPLQHKGATVLRDGRYPMSLHRALSIEIDHEEMGYNGDLLRELLAKGLTDLGFEVNYR
jgi:hypothetical protein